MILGKALGQLVFKINDWQYEVNVDAISDAKHVIIGFPHTSNLDTVRAMALFEITKLPYHILVKQEWFKFPIAGLLRKLGCIPVNRDKSANVVQQMVDEFAKHDKFSLVIAPEATRAKNGEKRPIKTGFWHIAKGTQVPIVLMLSDSATKTGRIFGKIMPSDSMENDLNEIKRLYAAYHVDIVLPEFKV